MDQLTHGAAQLHRIDLAREADFLLGDLTVQPSNLIVAGRGGSHSLQPRVMQVLVALARPPSTVVSQDHLITRCWSGLTVSTDAIGRCIGQLRRLAETWPDPPFAIVTVPGVGYRLNVCVQGEQDGGAETQVHAPVQSIRRPRLWLTGGAVFAALAAGLLGLAQQLGFGAPSPARRVVVLPIESLSTQPEARYLAAGVADEIGRALSDSQIEALPRTNAAALQEAVNARAAARLGIGLVLSGSIQETDAETLVNMRLANAATSVTVWSADFRRPRSDVSNLGEEVASKVADVVAMAEFARETPGMRTDDAAMSAFLTAQQLMRSNRSSSWGQFLALTQRVVASEPNFALGHSTAATADAYAIRWGAPAQQWPALVENARREAGRALALDPHDAAAYFALYLLGSDYDQKQAVLEKGLAIATHPTGPLGALYNSEGQILLSTGRLQDAVPYLQRSYGLDPLSPVKAASLIEAYALAGEPGAAGELARQARARWPDHSGLREAQLYLLTFYGPSQAALAALHTPGDLPADLSSNAIAVWRQYLRARAGHNNRDARQALSRAAEDGVLDLPMAILMLAQLHDLDDSFVYADRLADESGANPRVLFEPAAAPLRRDPRFVRLMSRFGLPAYWRKTGRWPDFCTSADVKIYCRAAFSAAGT